jgi:hypothetical protein
MRADHDHTAKPARRAERLALRALSAVDLFDAWVFAEADAGFALAAWSDAPHEHKADAYAAYAAALDREAQACGLLQARLAI